MLVPYQTKRVLLLPVRCSRMIVVINSSNPLQQEKEVARCKPIQIVRYLR